MLFEQLMRRETLLPIAIAAVASACTHAFVWHLLTKRPMAPPTQEDIAFDSVQINIVPAVPPLQDIDATSTSKTTDSVTISSSTNTTKKQPRKKTPKKTAKKTSNKKRKPTKPEKDGLKDTTNNETATSDQNTNNDSDSKQKASNLGMGSSANLLQYMPDKSRMAALLRFHKMRKLPWAKQIEKLVAPTPDARAMVGDRSLSISSTFDTMLISTTSPRLLTATTLVGKLHKSIKQPKTLLYHPKAPVTFKQYGEVIRGRRSPSRLVSKFDKRSFVLPFPGWMFLTTPANAGLAEKVPGWMSKIVTMEEQADGQSVILAATIRRKPVSIVLPTKDKLPGPTRIAISVESPQEKGAGGLIVRGTLTFLTPKVAEIFSAQASLVKDSFLVGFRAALAKSFGMDNALQGVRWKAIGKKVVFATSLSHADATLLFITATSFLEEYFASLQIH